jgi:drug/metabolite transporter (DMT)-like permease
MTLLGLTLVLIAAVSHASWNFLAKRVQGGAEVVWMFSAFATILLLPLAIGVTMFQSQPISSLGWIFIIGSSILHLVYFVSLQAGYRNGDLSLVYPTARSLGPLTAMVLATIFMSEVPTIQGGIGAIIIVGGVYALTGGKKQVTNKTTLSLAFGITAGLMIGSYTVWDAYAVSVLALPPILLHYWDNVMRTVILLPTAIKRRAIVAKHWRDHKIEVLGISVLSPLAYILILYAMSFTPVAYVAPLREVSVLLTVLAGSLILGEGHLKHRLTWAGVIMVGVVMLATS